MPPHLADLWSKQIIDRHSLCAGRSGHRSGRRARSRRWDRSARSRPHRSTRRPPPSSSWRATTSPPTNRTARTRPRRTPPKRRWPSLRRAWTPNRASSSITSARPSSAAAKSTSRCARTFITSPAATVETMTEDGNDGTAQLVQPYVDPEGRRQLPERLLDWPLQGGGRRDRGDRDPPGQDGAVVPQHGCRRDAAWRQRACSGGAHHRHRQSGRRGHDELQKFARKKGIMAGLIEPSDEEKASSSRPLSISNSSPIRRPSSSPRRPRKRRLRRSRRPRAPASRRSGGSRRRSRCGSLAARWTEGGAHARADRQDDRRGRQDQDRHSASAREAEIERTNAAANVSKARHSAFAGLAKLFGGGRQAQ
jgi:hypothetical protein